MLAPIWLLIVACSEGPPAEGDSRAEGTAAWRDAETDADGMQRPPDHPEPQPSRDPMRIEVTAEGTATYDLDAGDCPSDALTGRFTGLYSGEATVDDDGAWVGVLAANDAVFASPSGCDIPTLSLGAVTGLTLRAELSATTQNCDGYCTARARAEAEAACDGSTDASCRADEEAAWEASCTTSCTQSDHVIVAETDVSASALLDLDLDGASFGTIEADLVFDHVEDGQGAEVDDTPRSRLERGAGGAAVR